MKLEISKKFNPDLLKKIYRNKDDLLLAFPSASFPIVPEEWDTWIEKKESENYSLTFYINNLLVSHVAIKNYFENPGIVYLCFFIVDQDYRGRNFSKLSLQKIYEFVLNELKKKELWLVVNPKNKKAFN